MPHHARHHIKGVVAPWAYLPLTAKILVESSPQQGGGCLILVIYKPLKWINKVTT